MTDPVSSRPSFDRERSQRSGAYRAHSWSRRSKLLLLLVLVLVLIDFFTALLLGTQVYTLNRQNQTLRSSLAQTEEKLRQVTPELQKLRVDLEELIRGKLPRLRKLEYDQVLSLDDQYLKNITFTEIVNRDSRNHEYKLVVQNNTSAPLWPEIQLLVFNELGIQVGSAEIGTRQPNALKASSLGVGEVRSYTASIDLADEETTPTYFMIRFPEPSGGATVSLGTEEKR